MRNQWSTRHLKEVGIYLPIIVRISLQNPLCFWRFRFLFEGSWHIDHCPANTNSPVITSDSLPFVTILVHGRIRTIFTAGLTGTVGLLLCGQSHQRSPGEPFADVWGPNLHIPGWLCGWSLSTRSREQTFLKKTVMFLDALEPVLGVMFTMTMVNHYMMEN